MTTASSSSKFHLTFPTDQANELLSRYIKSNLSSFLKQNSKQIFKMTSACHSARPVIMSPPPTTLCLNPRFVCVSVCHQDYSKTFK